MDENKIVKRYAGDTFHSLSVEIADLLNTVYFDSETSFPNIPVPDYVWERATSVVYFMRTGEEFSELEPTEQRKLIEEQKNRFEDWKIK